MVINYAAIGKRIKKIRKRRGYSQLMLSEMIDRSPTYLSHIESGQKSMSLDTFILIVNALRISADELLLDNLDNTIVISNHELTSLLSDCSDYEICVLKDATSAVKKSLRENRNRFRK